MRWGTCYTADSEHRLLRCVSIPLSRISVLPTRYDNISSMAYRYRVQRSCKEDTRPALGCVLFKAKDGILELTAADGFRLAHAQIEASLEGRWLIQRQDIEHLGIHRNALGLLMKGKERCCAAFRLSAPVFPNPSAVEDTGDIAIADDFYPFPVPDPCLLIVDELGYMPIDIQRGNPFFQLVSRRYEKGSIILSTNKPFDRWGQMFGDDVIASAILDRLLHHCHIITYQWAKLPHQGQTGEGEERRLNK